MDVDAVSRFLAVLALVAGVGGVLVALLRRSPAIAPLRRHALAAAAAVAATATAGSLYYSEIAQFAPCELCWWQRLAMYPLAVLLTVAAVRRDDGIRPYAQVLAGLGLAVSLWHVGVQRFPSLAGTTSCSAEASCTVQWVDVFGLSIPAMAACGFVAVLALTSLPRGGDDAEHDDTVPTPTGAAAGARPSRHQTTTDPTPTPPLDRSPS